MSPLTSQACSSNAYDVQSEKVFAAAGEQGLDLLAPHGGAPRSQDAYRLGARPERPPGSGVAVVQRDLRLVQRGPQPGQEVVSIAHVFIMTGRPA
ncbi:hypothetical protein [Streptomyces sp. NPDC013457]|uniref:hypothetical protein n=1 Tax=Streptomyces sp. NPDC013457 TaxID=3364866 RepID=UPI0037033E25